MTFFVLTHTVVRARPEKPSSYPEHVRGPQSPELIKAVQQRQEARRRRATADRSRSAPQLEEAEVAAATTREPTRPAALSCRRIPAAINAPSALPRTSSLPSKRRLEMTPSTLAKKVAHRSTKSSREIADELASTYAMWPSERRTNENLVRAMRAAMD